jgi:MoaA/NifB/PqqE/SkfB family radical SAM enzyme
MNKDGRLIFTGGDPLMHPDFFKILEYTRSQLSDVKIHILGNPEMLTDSIIHRLKEFADSYQLSLDGLENTHDSIRHIGSFRDTLEKMDLLIEHGIEVVIRTTMNRLNLSEIPDIYDLVFKRGAEVFSIHRFVPVGAGRFSKDLAEINPDKYRRLLLRVYDHHLQHQGIHCKLIVKEPLWKLLEMEEGIRETDDLIFNDCVPGKYFCALPNGEFLICRMLPISVGKASEGGIDQILKSSSVIEQMKRVDLLEECGDCELRESCGGCRAMAYEVHGNYYSPDPYCWKIAQKLKSKEYSSSSEYYNK